MGKAALVIIVVTVLAFAAAIGMTDTVAQLTTSRIEVIEREAVVNQQVDQWNIERPYFQELMEADYAAELAQANQDRLLTEAETAAELASMQAATQAYIAGLNDRRQMALAEQQQKLIQSERLNMVGTILIAVVGVVGTLALGIIAIMVAYQRLNSKPAATAAGDQANDVWRDPVERRKRIDTLREIDRRERQRMIWQSSRLENSNGHRRSDSAVISPALIGNN